ncbi:aminoglycoside phosphotransferase family protein [Methylophaga lonarensis]|nr:phosphotransferase [Methylophaga lonarensis]
MTNLLPNDARIDAMRDWLNHSLDSDDFQLSVASSDASFRRYFRLLFNQRSYIVMDAPPEHEETEPFITIAEFMLSHGVPVPVIHAKNQQEGFLLLSDLGTTAYLDKLNNQTADALYKQAIDALLTMQLAQLNTINLPDYDPAKLIMEMQLFDDWFLQKHLGLEPPACLPALFELLVDNAVQQPQCLVHRDYHSRNLMLDDNNQLGVIDFQDAVNGPVSYDLVSLLRDCYIKWPDADLQRWLDYYFEQACDKGILNNVSRAQFQRWFDLMGLQRHIKVLGIFCRLNYRDDKSNYMNDLPMTLNYVREVSSRYPECQDFAQFLSQQAKIAAIQ